MSRILYNLPLMLSLSRIIFLPLLYFLLLTGYRWWFFGAYIVIGATDFFDGMVARMLKQTSPSGQRIDSLADFFFNLSSAYFIYHLFPEVVLNNLQLLLGFFVVCVLGFAITFIVLGKFHTLHTNLLRVNSLMLYLLVLTSFFWDTTWFARLLLISYYIGNFEKVLIYLLYGEVDADTRSIFSVNHP